nr:MAG TPA: hypothetical protein [Caudoviricetes sp.]
MICVWTTCPRRRAPGRSSPKGWSRPTAGRTCWGR